MQPYVCKNIAVFCGSENGKNPQFALAAKQFATLLCEHQINLIYGGASVGIMDILANTMLAQQGHVIGVIPQSLVDLEVAHSGLTELHVVASMHERKALISDLADAFVMLPGGLGTLDEFFEIWTWAQMGFHSKPIGVLNTQHYYNALFNFLDNATEENFVKPKQRGRIIIETEPSLLLQKMLQATPLTIHKWNETTTAIT